MVVELRQAIKTAEDALLVAPPAQAGEFMAEVSAVRQSLRQAESAPLAGLLDYWTAYYQLLRGLGATEA